MPRCMNSRLNNTIYQHRSRRPSCSNVHSRLGACCCCHIWYLVCICL